MPDTKVSVDIDLVRKQKIVQDIYTRSKEAFVNSYLDYPHKAMNDLAWMLGSIEGALWFRLYDELEP